MNKVIVIFSMLICSLFLLGCTNMADSHYEVRNDGVYYYHAIEEGIYSKVEGADPNTFKDLGCGYAKDRNRVYLAIKSINEIKGADPSTFKLINCTYSKDSGSVYYTDRRINEADLDSFEVLNRIYSKDKNNVYFYENIIENADPTSIEFFDKEDDWIDTYYSKDANNVYFNDQTLENSDPNSFVVISPINAYAKDNQNVYQKEELLHWIDAPSFELLGHYYYSKDKNNVYFFNRIVKGANPDDFEIIDVELSFHGEVDAKDNDNLYYRGEKLGQIDPSSYEPLKYENYVRDKNAIYYLRKNDNNEVTKVEFLEENDGVFEFVDGYRLYSWSGNNRFLKTDKAVYLVGHALNGIDAESFVSLNDYYSKDKNRVYTGFKLDLSNKVTFIPLEEADPESFEILEVPRFDDEVYGKDKNNFYYRGEIVMLEDIDPETRLLMSN